MLDGGPHLPPPTGRDNVQNGALKSLLFTFEYFGETGEYYIHAVTPPLEDALVDRRVTMQ